MLLRGCGCHLVTHWQQQHWPVCMQSCLGPALLSWRGASPYSATGTGRGAGALLLLLVLVAAVVGTPAAAAAEQRRVVAHRQQRLLQQQEGMVVLLLVLALALVLVWVCCSYVTACQPLSAAVHS